MIDVKEIKLPFKHGESPAIKWGQDFEELSDELKIVYLKKFASSMNYAADLIQKERNELVGKLEVMKRQVEHAQEAVGIQKATLIKTITDNNLSMQEAGDEITSLRGQIRKLKEVCDGDNS